MCVQRSFSVSHQRSPRKLEKNLRRLLRDFSDETPLIKNFPHKNFFSLKNPFMRNFEWR